MPRAMHAQADFGEAEVIIAGVRQRPRYFVMDLPQRWVLCGDLSGSNHGMRALHELANRYGAMTGTPHSPAANADPTV